ncbi:MAG: hypothetical protein ING84_18885 [Cytophagales bacterium]|jgi:hypothetical protein|nr:hypothetical protein [Cytophagales bacterium]MCA6369074.1 hypothetical protein [Cytophagales bacterium]MCA6373519.1 hypothetical protein [Cytophagales bacterium]MCA6377353.1 hypothetical protein [Cytophagales bacterium]MCA6385370.1 hypothetical protein [Cytophagales bacterium]
MKILKKFILANLSFNLDLSRYQFNASAMPYLIKQQSNQTCETVYHDGCIDLTSTTDENIDMIRKILYSKNRVDQSFDQCSVREKLDWEFRNCFGDLDRYNYDFRSYNMSKTQALNKARTVCLLSIIKKYWDAGDHPEHIYRTLLKQKSCGEINCNSGSEFYDHIKWYIRMGIFDGVLLNEARWSRLQ